MNSPKKKVTGADDIKKGCRTTWNFFLAANLDIVQMSYPAELRDLLVLLKL